MLEKIVAIINQKGGVVKSQPRSLWHATSPRTMPGRKLSQYYHNRLNFPQKERVTNLICGL
ncbi:MAG: hypothetical protein ACXWMH_07795 [Syntrophales bacterium]